MIFRLKTSKKTMMIFEDLQSKTSLKPFALAKLAIALSLKADYDTLNFNTDTYGLDLNKQTITGKFDVMYRCLIEQHSGKHLKEEEYFPAHVKAHIDRGASLLAEEYKYAKDFLSHLANLEDAI